ncbi:MAG: UPF0261 family protein [bacterium]|nr:UPF0261 family protein [bacterium]
MATVALVGTFDSKGSEYAFLRDKVIAAGCATIMVNAGVFVDPDYRVDFGRADVAAAAGADIGELAAVGDRGNAVAIQAEGAAKVVEQLWKERRIDGIIGLGGSGGTALVSRAMRQLPIGVPKLLVSTMASGDTSAYVDTADITMMYSVVDIAGINKLSAEILSNAAYAIAGMARGHEAYCAEGDDRPLVGATQYGTTTRCVDEAREWLEDAGCGVLAFHATGPGGRSMEALMASGHIVAALDITTTELMDEVAGGTTTAGPDRLDMAGSLGLPQVVSVGATDQITFRPPSAVPDHMEHRRSYRHNPAITLVRSNAAEMAEYGRLLCSKLNRAKGPVTVFVPLRSVSEYDQKGGVFHDPDSNSALFDVLRSDLAQNVELIEMDNDINDPEFALAMARRLDEHIKDWAATADQAAGGESA